MEIMIEGKDGKLAVYGVKEINREIQAAVKSARELYCVGGIKHSALDTHLLIGKDGQTSLAVGLLYPDGWKRQFNVAL